MIVQDLQGRSREELVSMLREAFPERAATDTALSALRGGRRAALALLAGVKPRLYEQTRNFLDGDVTRLSAYLRHGVLTLAEARDSALQQAASAQDAGKLVNEYAWRDYWQRLYEQIGDGVWDDREPWKTGFRSSDYADSLPSDIPDAKTTLACMDGFALELAETGYLHNHARLWTAAYVVHWRRVTWQAGARWFLEHLLDGDPASNNLSWQWVASTFASKPYFFNRANLQHYTRDAFCQRCPHAVAGTCPFEGEYEALEQRLFPQLHARAGDTSMPPPPQPFAGNRTREVSSSTGEGQPLLWVHTDALNPDSPMLAAFPEAPALFVWDGRWIAESGIRLKRLLFLAECLQEMPARMELRQGDVAAEVLSSARTTGAAYVLSQRTPDPRLLAAASEIERHLPVVWYDPPPFAEGVRAMDLKRFSRYWNRAQRSAMLPTEPAVGLARP